MTDEGYMQQAIKEAEKAASGDEVPVGAIIVLQQKIIARAHNQVELLNDSTAHAEIMALTTAYNFLGSKYLPEAVLYVTIEPCLMCCGALYWSKIGKVIYGANDVKNGYKKFTGEVHPFHPKTVVEGGNSCRGMQSPYYRFFQAKRGGLSK